MNERSRFETLALQHFGTALLLPLGFKVDERKSNDASATFARHDLHVTIAATQGEFWGGFARAARPDAGYSFETVASAVRAPVPAPPSSFETGRELEQNLEGLIKAYAVALRTRFAMLIRGDLGMLDLADRLREQQAADLNSRLHGD